MGEQQLQLPAAFLEGWTKPSPGRIEARAAIVQLRADGHGRKLIARTLNARGIPTPSGRGSWHPSTVRHFEDPSGWAMYMRRYKAARRR